MNNRIRDKDLSTMIRHAYHAEKYKPDKLFNAEEKRLKLLQYYNADGTLLKELESKHSNITNTLVKRSSEESLRLSSSIMESQNKKFTFD